jgi:hypothetical protein
MYRLPTSFALLAALILLGDPAVAQQRFNGNWTVEAVPEKGACKRARRYAIAIENGSIRNTGRRRVPVTTTGGLEESGRIRGSIQSGKTRVDVAGSLSGRSGSGNWVIAGRVTCSGRWTAEKRS